MNATSFNSNKTIFVHGFFVLSPDEWWWAMEVEHTRAKKKHK